jgi:hypothetical protein
MWNNLGAKKENVHAFKAQKVWKYKTTCIDIPNIPTTAFFVFHRSDILVKSHLIDLQKSISILVMPDTIS